MQSRKFKETISHVIFVLHIVVCTKWIIYLGLWWNIGYLQGPPRDGAYGYVPLNIPPRAPSRTPRLNNIQIYREILLLNHRHQGTVLLEMSSIYSCDIPPRVWSREARYQAGGKKSICSVFSRTHPNVLVYCDFHNYKSILISLYHLSY